MALRKLTEHQQHCNLCVIGWIKFFFMKLHGYECNLYWTGGRVYATQVFLLILQLPALIFKMYYAYLHLLSRKLRLMLPVTSSIFFNSFLVEPRLLWHLFPASLLGVGSKLLLLSTLPLVLYASKMKLSARLFYVCRVTECVCVCVWERERELRLKNKTTLIPQLSINSMSWIWRAEPSGLKNWSERENAKKC